MRAALFAIALAACGPPADPVFEANYKSTFTEVRNCRPSSEHDLHNVHVLANALAMEPYLNRDAEFPVGAILLKEEYDFGDIECSDAIVYWTVMEKLPAGSSPTTLDWHWQKVDPKRNVVTDDEARCISCHTMCGVAPDGYMSTCEVP